SDLTNAEELLPVLASHSVKANFYAPNEAARQTLQEPLLKKIAEAGHVIGQYQAAPLPAAPEAEFFDAGFAGNDATLATMLGDVYDNRLILLPEDPALLPFENAAKEKGFTAYAPTAVIYHDGAEAEEHPDWLLAIGDFSDAVAIMPMDKEGNPFMAADLEWLIDYLQTHDFTLLTLRSDVPSA
ncbi:MAG: hypothetical protein FWD16_08285, partial [Clostridia bacterium]|nr:hypothetical protein [Clostridia bacterium]